MIPVARVPEPPDFDSKARTPGLRWLAENPTARRPRDYWSPFRHELAAGFEHRCAYSAMLDLGCTVDHFESFEVAPRLSYEWSNYRYCSQWLNSSKKGRRVLDPHAVGEGWFEVLLPSLQLILTDKVPEGARALAEETLRSLPIGSDERVIRQRRHWYRLYQQGSLSLDGLRAVAPLIAAAVEKQIATAAT